MNPDRQEPVESVKPETGPHPAQLPLSIVQSADPPLSRRRRFSKTSHLIFIITPVLLVPSVLWGLVVLLSDNLNVGFFGPLLLLGLVLYISGLLLPAVPMAWLTCWLFERFFIPGRRYGLASVWAVLCAVVAGAAFYGLHTWPPTVALRQDFENTFLLGFTFGFIGFVLGALVPPLLGLKVLIRRSRRQPAGNKHAVMICLTGGVIALAAFSSLLYLNSYMVRQMQRHPVFGIYIPTGGSLYKLESVKPVHFDLSKFNTEYAKGPFAIAARIQGGVFIQAPAGSWGVQQPKSQVCLPAGYTPDKFDKDDFQCKYVFTTPGGVRVFKTTLDAVIGADVTDTAYFFVLDNTFLVFETSLEQAGVSNRIDDLVPATGIQGARFIVPAGGDFRSAIRPTKTVSGRQLGVYYTPNVILTSRQKTETGLDLRYKYLPAGAPIAVQLSESLAESSDSQRSFNRDYHYGPVFTSAYGSRVYAPDSDYFQVKYYLTINDTSITVQLNYLDQYERQIIDRRVSQGEAKTIINSLTKRP